MSILRRLPGSRFSEVVREWVGGIAAILAGGPSLTVNQVEKVRQVCEAGRCRAIVVNDSYLWAPWADVLYAADSQWWAWQAAGKPKPLLGLTAEQVRERYAAFQGQKCSIEHAGSNIVDPDVHLLRNRRSANNAQGLSLDPGFLETAHGKNSGFQALNLAVLAGTRTVILLGFDGRPADDGRSHFHGGHPKPTPPAFFEAMRRAFSAAEREIAAAGVRVLNCSPGSAIDSFPKVSLEAALG